MSKADVTKTSPSSEVSETAEIIVTPSVPSVPASSSGTEEAPKAMRFRVNFNFGLNLRSEPGYGSAILKVLPYGTEVESHETVSSGDGIWVHTEGGWVDSRYLSEV